VSSNPGAARSFRVVGVGVLPALGLQLSDHTSLGRGALVTAGALRAMAGEQGATSTVLVALRPGRDVGRESAHLARLLGPFAESGALEPFDAQRPADIVNSRSMGRAPLALAGLLGLAAVA